MKMRIFARPVAAAFIAGTLCLAACSGGNRQPVQEVVKVDTVAMPAGNTASSVYQLEGKWVTQKRDTIALHDLRGKVQVIAMVFTHCKYACPKLAGDMLEIEKGLPADIKNKVGFTLVSFDVDRDTVGQLQAFAREMGLGDNWTLLHGSEQEVRELSMLLDVNYEKQDDGNFNHTSVITILDRGGAIVHRHEGLDMDAREMVGKVVAAVK